MSRQLIVTLVILACGLLPARLSINPCARLMLAGTPYFSISAMAILEYRLMYSSACPSFISPELTGAASLLCFVLPFFLMP